ncbi:thioredoxin [Hymenobacter sp. BT664]|uniref:Thioredoxin n=1 Tax=Hymenobacter montanus TaxID=2771359 RepID=A0A927BCU1_9BACT|nr:thioredoxin [Hymenobacter montanus]MBD2767925.1 thioredoxin [Hymenobacter montanus]
MSLTPPPSALPAAAVLLVLLPRVPADQAALRQPAQAALRALQGRLGSAVRVLKIDEATHPAVVQSFDSPELPACVLVRQGVELWRQQGLPDEADVNTLLEAAQRA